MQVTEAQHKFVGELVDLVATQFGDEREIHPETAVASAARLAGSFMFRSFNLELEGIEPGTLILSKEADEAGPHLADVLAAALQLYEVKVDIEKLGENSEMKGEDAGIAVVESLAALQFGAMLKAQENGLNPVQAAQAAAIAAGFIIKQCEGSIGADVGFNVAAFGFIEGCKTVPPPLQPPAS